MRILDLLRTREHSIGELADELGMSEQHVSKHLAMLTREGVLGCRKEGNRAIYGIADETGLTANGSLAAAGYMRAHGSSEFRFTGIHVLRVEGAQIAEITTFGALLCGHFELPMIFSAEGV